MKKIKIAFLAPKNKWWTYYYYKDIVEYLNKEYSTEFEVHFFNSLSSYIKLHFLKFDIVFSIIPFLFKPLFVKKYIYNLHWNYKIERKNKWLWVKLLYLSEINLWFCDNIMLTSYYLADKLNFRKKYDKKIIINTLFVDKVSNNKKEIDKKNINFLTVSSSNFLEKGLWVFNLSENIFNIKNININWKIVLPWDKNNKNIILEKINYLKKNNNINFEVLDFLDRNELNKLYKDTDLFVYASNLETWWWVIMEACSYAKPVILLKNDLWEYIYPKEIITDNLEKKLFEILENYNFYSDLSYNFALKFQKENVMKDLVKIIKE